MRPRWSLQSEWALSESLWLALLFQTGFYTPLRAWLVENVFSQGQSMAHSLKEPSLSVYYVVEHCAVCEDITQNRVRRSWQEDSDGEDKQ